MSRRKKLLSLRLAEQYRALRAERNEKIDDRLINFRLTKMRLACGTGAQSRPIKFKGISTQSSKNNGKASPHPHSQPNFSQNRGISVENLDILGSWPLRLVITSGHMRSIRYVPLAYLAGIHGFALFAPYLAFFLTAQLLLSRRRVVVAVAVPA